MMKTCLNNNEHDAKIKKNKPPYLCDIIIKPSPTQMRHRPISLLSLPSVLRNSSIKVPSIERLLCFYFSIKRPLHQVFLLFICLTFMCSPDYKVRLVWRLWKMVSMGHVLYSLHSFFFSSFSFAFCQKQVLEVVLRKCSHHYY